LTTPEQVGLVRQILSTEDQEHWPVLYQASSTATPSPPRSLTSSCDVLSVCRTHDLAALASERSDWRVSRSISLSRPTLSLAPHVFTRPCFAFKANEARTCGFVRYVTWMSVRHHPARARWPLFGLHPRQPHRSG
jgi:hypothetical protein